MKFSPETLAGMRTFAIGVGIVTLLIGCVLLASWGDTLSQVNPSNSTYVYGN
jgi:hypothetical protein